MHLFPNPVTYTYNYVSSSKEVTNYFNIFIAGLLVDFKDIISSGKSKHTMNHIFCQLEFTRALEEERLSNFYCNIQEF